MKKSFKMIAADLDRTLLRDNETLSAVTINAIREARKKGMLFVVATARSLYSTLLVTQELYPDAIIHTGGAYAVVGDQVIYRAVLSPEDTLEAALACLSAPFVDHIRICGETEDVTTNPAIPVGQKEFLHYRRVSDEKLTETALQAATKITVCSPEPDKVATLFEGDPRYLFTPSKNTSSFGHKLAHPAATKEAALVGVATHFGVTCDEIVAFGDDMADLGMLSVCGLGVAVANAIPEVKTIADVVCGSNEEDGVAHYINEFFL
ncbi:MAG: HAD-IIB family hydrolase [Ruminococcaceae bacterium]|nr:HAD-IIB family hydrolase [Oscillospiraceae bacterium]